MRALREHRTLEWHPGPGFLAVACPPWRDYDVSGARIGDFWITFGSPIVNGHPSRFLRADAVLWLPRGADLERYLRLRVPGSVYEEGEQFTTKGEMQTCELLWRHRHDASLSAAVWVAALGHTIESSRSYERPDHWRGDPYYEVTDVSAAACRALGQHRRELWHHAMTGVLFEAPLRHWFGPLSEHDVYGVARCLAMLAQGGGEFIHLVVSEGEAVDAQG